MVTEPVAVTTFPMALVSRAELLCAPAGPGRTTLADRIRPAINPAIICARIWFHSPKVNVFSSTLLYVEQRGAALAPFRWGWDGRTRVDYGSRRPRQCQAFQALNRFQAAIYSLGL